MMEQGLTKCLLQTNTGDNKMMRAIDTVAPNVQNHAFDLRIIVSRTVSQGYWRDVAQDVRKNKIAKRNWTMTLRLTPANTPTTFSFTIPYVSD